jgi:predicted ATPase
MSTAPELEPVEPPLERSKPAFLRRVKIRGYKSIAFCDVTLEPLTLLVGRNASGKSNFLDALAFLRDAMETSIPEAVRRHGGWSTVVSRLPSINQIAFEVEVGFTCGRPFERLGERFTTIPTVVMKPSPLTPSAPALPDYPGTFFLATYGFTIEVGAGDIPVLVQEYLRFPDEKSGAEFGFEVNRGKFSANWKVTNETSGPFILEPQFKINPYRPDRLFLSVIGNQPFIDVADGIRYTGFYNFHPDAIRQLQTPDPGSMLAQDGCNLASLIESVGEIDEGTVKRVGAYLAAVVEEVEEFRVVRYGAYETVKFGLRTKDPDKPVEFDARSMSDGTLRVLASLMAAFQIHLPSGPTVVGIEEPETSLHPAAMRALVDALDEATLRTQILLTTHSAEMLDNPTIRPENVRVVEMIDGQTVIAPVDAASVEIVQRKLDTLGGLERQNQLQPDFDDLNRQRHLSLNGQEPKG